MRGPVWRLDGEIDGKEVTKEWEKVMGMRDEKSVGPPQPGKRRAEDKCEPCEGEESSVTSGRYGTPPDIDYPEVPEGFRDRPLFWIVDYTLNYINVLLSAFFNKRNEVKPSWASICISELVDAGVFEDKLNVSNGSWIWGNCLLPLRVVACSDLLEKHSAEIIDSSPSLKEISPIIYEDVGGQKFKFGIRHKVTVDGVTYVVASFFHNGSWHYEIFWDKREIEAQAFEDKVKELLGRNEVWRAIISFGGEWCCSLDFPERFHSVGLDGVYLDESIKRLVVDNTILFLDNLDWFVARGIDNGRKLLVYGDPGNGKSLLFKAMAKVVNDTGYTVLLVEPERQIDIDAVFEVIDALSPALVMWDDIDIYATDRADGNITAMLGGLLGSLDGSCRHPGYVLAATTNRLDIVEKAMSQRPGRFDRVIEIPAPDTEARGAIFKANMIEHDISKEAVTNALHKLDNRSGAHVKELAHGAIINAKSNGRDKPNGADLKASLRSLDTKVQAGRTGF